VQVAQAHPNAQLLFVGDGPDQPALQAQARQLGLEECVTFLGDQLNIPHLLPALDILALPSLHEGMPNVALEAMAASLPVVATAVGGTPEVVVDRKTGILVPSRDPTSLVKALTMLINHPEHAKLRGQAGRQRIETHFNLATTVHRTETLYETLLLERLNQRYEAQVP
jgi:glycosyltransferase involved in cell wall biosynthesis